MDTAAVTALREWALYLAAMGWPVFPIAPGAKKPPAVRDWEHRASTDPDRITRCWSARGAFNIGVATGPAGLLVVDLDTPTTEGQPNGTEVLAEVATARGVTVPPTYTVHTPSGGQHLYFTTPAGVVLRNTSRALGPSIDTRAGGGYVAGPGSLTPTGGYELADDRDPAELPAWLVQALCLPPPATPAGPPRGAGNPHAYAASALRQETERVRHAPAGQHNAVLSTAAYHLGQLVGAALLPMSTARFELHTAADPLITGQCGCTRREITRVIEAGLATGTTRPRGNTTGGGGPVAA